MPPARADWIDAAGFAAVAGPELTRRFGFRLSLRPAAEPPAAAGPEALVAVAEASTAPGALAIGIDRRSIGSALDRMFGAADKAGTEGQDPLPALAPGCSSWMALALLLADAMGEALMECGLRPSAPPRPIQRPAAMAPAAPADCQWFALDLAGTGGWMAITRSPRPPAVTAETETQAQASALPTAPPAGGADQPVRLDAVERGGGDGWQARAAALSHRIELPVGVRIAEIRLPLEQAMRLSVGEILPIDRPRLLMLSVDGVPWRPVERLPSSKTGGDPS